MFTGIIQAVGKVVKYDGHRIWIATPFRKPAQGESISINGVCLTVSARKKTTLAFDVGRQTQRITTLGELAVGSTVNLERALRVGDRLGGHWVSGHVEATGKILKIEKAKQSSLFTFEVPRALLKYVVAKGSIAMDGISLTVAAIRGKAVQIMIIPHTLSHTTLGSHRLGDRVNIETDVLAKYIQRR